ncbi:MAG TPA: NF038129 family PEP-CTERM protein [Candidatus Acidoferrum sp.]|nr:NF038129 family PEP-CTERM protein [Candidatus Acidoferrum sp.]
MKTGFQEQNMKTNRKLLFGSAILFALVLATFGSQAARADSIVNVSVDTSSIASIPGAEIFFILTDGNGTGDANNTATLSNFSLGLGTPGAIDALNSTGGVTGSLSTGVSLVDSAFLNVLGQLFTPGNTLSYALDLTTNVDGTIPDQFSMILVDSNGNPLPTNDPNGFGDLLVVNLGSANPVVTNYAPSLVTLGSSTPPPPPVTTPEPSSILLLGSAILSLVGIRGRKSVLAGSSAEK